MSITAKLFYIVPYAEELYSIYSLKNDREIMHLVSEELVSKFLIMNEPEHPFLMFSNYEIEDNDVDLESIDLIINKLNDSAYNRRPNYATNRCEDMDEIMKELSENMTTVDGVIISDFPTENNLCIDCQDINWLQNYDVSVKNPLIFLDPLEDS
jgi:hypothetical protein